MNLKTILQPLCLMAILLAMTAAATAQTFSVINSFGTNEDGTGGASPQSGLTVVGTNLFGSTLYGGVNGTGALFKFHSDGTGYTEFKSFSAVDGNGFNSDGANPQGELVSSGSVLYGVTQYGGAAGQGVVFSVNTDGTGFTNLYSFDDTNPVSPVSGLLLDGGTLYGVTPSGGTNAQGGLYKINLDGSGYSNFYSFSGADGTSPSVGLVIADGMLFGTASDGPAQGGVTADGTVFSVSTDGSGFSNIYTFTTPVRDSLTGTHTNQDGAGAPARLILLGDALYGITPSGGSSGQGTVFILSTDGTVFNVIENLPGTRHNGSFGNELLLVGNTLYGTTTSGGATQNGTIFRVNTDSSNFGELYDFSGGNDGGSPETSLVLLGTSIYGTASVGGLAGVGTIFKLSLVSVPVALNIQSAGETVILTWTDPSFALQSAPTLTGVYTNVPNATSPYPAGSSVGTAFFRLKK